MRATSSEYFVIKPKSTGVPAGLQVQEVGSTGLFLFQSRTPAEDGRTQWRGLIQKFGDQLDFVAPVMVDDRGQQQLPTGKIVVQFHTPPSEETLHALERTYGLRCLKRNEFKQEQVIFEMIDHKAAYPPDLIASLESDPSIKFAAPEILARFSRA
jgi:hypothetical protein